jgi:hypothetical protein
MADPREPEDEIDGIEDEADEGTDAGQIDDQSGDETDGYGQGDEVEEAQERVARAPRDNRIRDEIRALREHNQRVEQEIQNLRQEREDRQQASQVETEAQFQARVSLLEPEQRMDEKLARADRMHRQSLAAQQLLLADRFDKSNYDSHAATDPIYRKYAQEVEQLVLIERKKGHDINRETALDFLRGRNARLKAQKATPTPAPRRAASQQTRTTGGRGDQPREERRERRYAANDMSPEAVKQRLFKDDAYI